MTFNIEFDYRFDNQGFFSDPIRRNTLEQAANIWESRINDDFTSIPASESLSVLIAYLTNVTSNGYSTATTSQTVTLTQPINDLLIFVYSLSLPSGSSIQGVGGPFGQWQVGSERDNRYNSNNFEPWAGTIYFNYSSNFFFDTTPNTSNDIPSNQTDFLTIALHEIGHVLGIGTSPAFQNQVTGQGFNGAISRSLNGGQPIPLAPDLSHVREGFTLASAPEDLMDPSSLSGTRILPTSLDLGILQDIGYTIAPPDLSKKNQLTTPIIRFQNQDKPGTYLFAGEQEAASIRQNNKNFKEEGFAFQVAVSKNDSLMQPFYRFQNTDRGREGTYLFAGEQESASIRQNNKNFKEEGFAFYAYSAGVGGGTTEFARFQNKSLLQYLRQTRGWFRQQEWDV
jgi:hypothetical protein